MDSRKTHWFMKLWGNDKDYSKAAQKCKADGSAGVGWHDINGGGINQSLLTMEENEINTRLQAAQLVTPCHATRNQRSRAHIMKIFRWVKEMAPGDLITFVRGKEDIVLEGVITEGYYFDTRPNDPLWLPHRIRFAATPPNSPRKTAKGKCCTIHRESY